MCREADVVREALRDDPFVTNEDYGRLVEEAADADERRSLEAERGEPVCNCPSDATGPWDCMDCPTCGEAASAAAQAEAEAEQRAENAWLHAAENTYYDEREL